MTASRVADLVVEVVVGGTTRARVADLTVETLVHPTTKVRVADLAVESPANPTTKIRVADVVIEPLESTRQPPPHFINTGPTGTRISRESVGED